MHQNSCLKAAFSLSACLHSCTRRCIFAGPFSSTRARFGPALVSTGSEMLKWAAWLPAALSYIPPTQHISIAAAKGSGRGYRVKKNL